MELKQFGSIRKILVLVIVLALSTNIYAYSGSTGLSIVSLTATTVSSLVEDFSTLIIKENVIGVGAPLQCENGQPKNQITFTPSSIVNKWGFHSSPVYPLAWSGSGAAQAWAVSGNQMFFHGVKGTNDDGHAILSRDIFDRTKYIVATATIRTYCSTGGSGCFAGIALINQESNYRGIYLQTIPNGQTRIERLGPCNQQTTGVSVAANTFKKLSIEYRGPEGGKWSYYVDGQRVDSTTAVVPSAIASYVVGGIENTGVTNADVALTVDPRLGIYTNTSVPGSFVEGAVKDVSVRVLGKLSVSSMSASSNAGAAWGAVDGNSSSLWVASGGGSQWIEVDLGAVRTIRKVRLLTEQSPAGQTQHDVYVGNTPNPSTLVKTYSEVTQSLQWLDHTFVANPPTGRFIRIITPVSPSWRAWREIELYE